MPDDVVVKVENVSKDFVLPHEKITTVKGLFTSAYKKRSKSKSMQHALKNVSIEIHKGEFFGIVGRNGSGKSTMLKMLAGIYQPTSGRITTLGKLVPFIELGVGFNPELTGRENVYLNGAMMGFSEKQVDDMYDEIVAFAELEPFMDQKLKNYSSGMQVRLAFSVAIKAEAEILLVDEVLAVGDADFQRKCFQYFKSLKKNKKTVVFVTHDMNAVREFCDRAALIDKSELVTIGSPSNIATKYTQLFMDDSEEQAAKLRKEAENEAINRWGNGTVVIDKVGIPKQILTGKDEELKITLMLRAARKYDEGLVCGFVVKDASGEALTGSNTKVEHQLIPPLQQGEICTIVWSCPNIFADGEHSIDVAVHSNDGVTVYDWWEDAVTFHVRREEKTAYKITPQIRLSISEPKKA
jgi:ABC-2 type transport system ATP-binding protein